MCPGRGVSSFGLPIGVRIIFLRASEDGTILAKLTSVGEISLGDDEIVAIVIVDFRVLVVRMLQKKR